MISESLYPAPLSLSLLSLSLSHSRSAAIEIANQLFDLRKLISSEFVMSYSPRRAEEAVGLTGPDAAEGGTVRASERRSLGRTKKMRIVVGRLAIPLHVGPSALSIRAVDLEGGRQEGRRQGRLSDRLAARSSLNWLCCNLMSRRLSFAPKADSQTERVRFPHPGSGKEGCWLRLGDAGWPR